MIKTFQLIMVGEIRTYQCRASVPPVWSRCLSDDVLGSGASLCLLSFVYQTFFSLINILGRVHWTGKLARGTGEDRTIQRLFTKKFLAKKNTLKHYRTVKPEGVLWPRALCHNIEKNPSANFEGTRLFDLLSNDFQWTMLIKQNFIKFLILSTWSIHDVGQLKN